MKVLLLSSATGEGHNSAGKAVMDALTEKGVECVFIDPISFQSEAAEKKVSGIYNNIISHIPALFGIIYAAGAIYDRTPLPSPVLKANSKYSSKLAEYIKDEGFDAVVCPHLFAMQAMRSARLDHGLYVPTYCVLTDHTAHPFHKDAKPLDIHFAPSEKVKAKMVKRGFDSERVVVSGIPANPKFSISTKKREIKEQLGISGDKKIISVMSGGAGCGKIVKLCKKFAKRLTDGYAVYVFPGKNEKLRAKLVEKFGTDPKFKIIPFTNDIHLYIKASEVVLSKPGGLSSTEIATANIPFVQMKAIPGCESYNVRYYKNNGIAFYGKSVRRAIKYAFILLEDDCAAQKMKEAQRAFIPQYAANFIADQIIANKTVMNTEAKK